MKKKMKIIIGAEVDEIKKLFANKRKEQKNANELIGLAIRESCQVRHEPISIQVSKNFQDREKEY